MTDYINLYDYAEAVKSQLSEMAYSYYLGGAGDALSRDANRSAFDQLHLWPRMMVDVSQRDLTTTVLGQELAMPLLVAPTAMAALAHPDKEMAIARAAKEAGIIMTTSTLSTTSVETLTQTEANLWFQLYVHKDRGLTQALVQRAEASGCKALVLTVDVPVIGQREYMRRIPLILPDDIALENLEGYWNPDDYPNISAYVREQFDPSLTWHDLEKFASSTSLPVVVKGILRPDDARLAIEHGAAGIIVSNHGGRQLDTVPPTITALPYIVDAVGDQTDILVDGGIRRGTDIIKALAYGARAVLVGRPVLWGLAVNGQAGVSHIFELLRSELDTTMALCGIASAQEIPQTLIQP